MKFFVSKRIVSFNFLLLIALALLALAANTGRIEADAPYIETKILADDGAASDLFGYSVAVSGDTAVVGTIRDDDNGSDSGSVYVFERNEGGADNWGQVIKLLPSDGASGDWFGYSVAVSGYTVVVGASRDDDNGGSSGSAYVFERNEGGADNWGQVVKLLPGDGAAFDEFGYLVAVSGDTVVVGAISDVDNGVRSGSAYVFERNEGGADNWGQVLKLLPGDGAAGDFFGISVAASDDTVIVAAYLDDDNGANSGSAYVFDFDTNAIVNDSLSLDSLDIDYVPADPRAPAGVFTVTTTFTNTSADSLSDAFFEVTTLTGGNTVLNADEGDGGVGSIVYAGDLLPGESFEVVFEIGLDVRAPFEFFVDAFGVVD